VRHASTHIATFLGKLTYLTVCSNTATRSLPFGLPLVIDVSQQISTGANEVLLLDVTHV
jgi:hypothetical protein